MARKITDLKTVFLLLLLFSEYTVRITHIFFPKVVDELGAR